MLSMVDHHVISRERSVVRVDFRRDPDPPAPYFPGALGLRLRHSETRRGRDADGRNRSEHKERASICAGF